MTTALSFVKMSARISRKKSRVTPALLSEIYSVYHLLAKSEEQIHAEEELTAAERGVLFLLFEEARSMPDVADLRNVTRQRIQQIVQKLLDLGFVEPLENRRHASSPLYSVTRTGTRKVARLMTRESVYFSRLFPGLSIQKMESLTATLKQMRSSLKLAVQ